jgi:hypothetical protein
VHTYVVYHGRGIVKVDHSNQRVTCRKPEQPVVGIHAINVDYLVIHIVIHFLMQK